jgi:dolichol-phosphate mannosyltransferase
MQAGSETSVAETPFLPHTSTILISMATFNEGLNVEELINEILQKYPEAHVLVTDDNSPDGTGKIVDRMIEKDSRIRIIHRSGKLGLGTAMIAAMKYAIQNNYEMMVNLDGDFSHPPRYLPDLINGMTDRDVMIGSRYIPGGSTVNWPWSRRTISRSVNRLVRLLFGMPARDASGGYRCYRVSLLRKLPYEKMRSKGYSFQQEVLFRLFQQGARIGETPIIFENRKQGKSKVSLKESIVSLSTLIKLGLQHRLGLKP